MSKAIGQIEMNFYKPVLDGFTQGYLRCALWATNNVHGEPLDEQFTIEDFEAASLDVAIKDCDSFRKAAGVRLTTGPFMYAHAATVGHNFWLSRNGHGTGLWAMFDHPSCEEVHKIALAYGEKHVFTSYDHGVCF